MPETLTSPALDRWRRDPETFIEEMLRDPETGAPFDLLEAERQFLRHCFQRDQDGRLLYSEQVYACPKKSGKSTWAAILTLTATLVFGGRFAEAYIVANDLEQAQARVFAMIRRIVEASPDLQPEAKITQSRIEFPALGAFIQAVGADYAGAAGGNPVVAVFDELWAYTSERSRRLFDEMVPSPARAFSYRLTVTYAGFSGESVLLEELRKRGTSQPVVGPDLHAGNGILCFWTSKLIAPWQTTSWVEQMRGQLRPAAFTRMILNEFSASEEAFIDVAEWDACCTVLPVASDRYLPIWVGIDASVKRDSTALVACTYDAKSKRVRLIAHKIFQPTPDAPLDFEATIEATILLWRNRFTLRAVHYDPFQMAAVAARLQRAGIRMVEYPQTLPNLTAMADNLFELVRGRQIAVYPDDAIRLAVRRAIVVESARGWRIAKEKQAHKIDVLVALAMSALAAVEGAHRGGPCVTNALGGTPNVAQWHWERGWLTGPYANKQRTQIRIVRVPEVDAPAARGWW
jgi:phage terminase large subunit-like protein